MIRKRTDYIKTSDRLGKVKYLMPCYNIIDVYKLYKKPIKKRIPSKYNIDRKLFKQILENYNKGITNALLDNIDVNIPNSIGTIMVRKRFYDNVSIDTFTKSKKVIMDDGCWVPIVKIKRNFSRIKNLRFYSFKPSSIIKRKLQSIFKTKEGHKKYFEV